MDDSVIQLVKQSYGRALADKSLMKRFYENFVSSHPAVAVKFAGVDLERQQDVLKMSLSMAIVFPQNNIVAKRAMDKVQLSHGGDGLGIEAELYTHWLESLVSTIEECDPAFTPELERNWRAVLGCAIQHISCPAMA